MKKCIMYFQWEVPSDYINVILGIKDNLTKDLVYILMAKGLHCISIKVCGRSNFRFNQRNVF